MPVDYNITLADNASGSAWRRCRQSVRGVGHPRISRAGEAACLSQPRTTHRATLAMDIIDAFLPPPLPHTLSLTLPPSGVIRADRRLPPTDGGSGTCTCSAHPPAAVAGLVGLPDGASGSRPDGGAHDDDTQPGV